MKRKVMSVVLSVLMVISIAYVSVGCSAGGGSLSIFSRPVVEKQAGLKKIGSTFRRLYVITAISSKNRRISTLPLCTRTFCSETITPKKK